MKRLAILACFALPVFGQTTLNFSMRQYGAIPYLQTVAIGGTGTITNGACSTVSDPSNICGNGGLISQIVDGGGNVTTTAPATLRLWWYGAVVNSVPAGTHTLAKTVSSTGFSVTLTLNLNVIARTTTIAASISGSFTGCSNTSAVYSDLDTCTVPAGYPGVAAGRTVFSIPAQGATYVDPNFGGIVRILTPPSLATRVVNADATSSMINLDASLVVTATIPGSIYLTNTTTGADTWNITTIQSTCSSITPSNTVALRYYCFQNADNTIRSYTMVTPPSTWTQSAALYTYPGTQTNTKGISNGGDGSLSKDDRWAWATQQGTDHIVGLTNLAAVNPQAETYTANFGGLAVMNTVYTITGMSGNGVTPVHVTFSPPYSTVGTGIPTAVRFNSGAVGNTALNGALCTVLGGFPGGSTTSAMDCYNFTGNGTWTSGGSFQDVCGNGTGYALPPCSRAVTVSKGYDADGSRYVYLSVDVGQGNDYAEIYRWRPGDTALTDLGHAAAYPSSPYRSIPTYGSTGHCDDVAWLAHNCLVPTHADTVEAGGHQWLVTLVQEDQPYNVGFLRMDNPDLMLTTLEAGGGYAVGYVSAAQGALGFGQHNGCAAFAPVCAWSTDQDPNIPIFNVTAMTGNGITPINVTSSPNYSGSNGDTVIFGGAVGNTALNDNGACVVANLSGASFDCTGTTGNGTWTSGGRFTKDATPGASAHQGEVILLDATSINTKQFTAKRLAKSRSWGYLQGSNVIQYYTEPHAVISPDGSLIAFESNFGYLEKVGVNSVATGYVIPPTWPGSIFRGILNGIIH